MAQIIAASSPSYATDKAGRAFLNYFPGAIYQVAGERVCFMNEPGKQGEGILKAAIALLFVILAAIEAEAKVDTGRFDLTEKQIALIGRLEARGIAEAELEKLARAFERANHPYERYIPPHTRAELEAVTAWAEGGAFASFARDAQVNFDRAAYMADCPNLALFNFGRANGTAYLGADVLLQFTNAVYNLENLLRKHPADFRAAYLGAIAGTAFEKYVID